MKAGFVLLCLLVITAEVIPKFWFQESGQEFDSLEGESGVRRVSLEEERAADLLDFDRGLKFSSDRGGEVDLILLTWNRGNSHGLMDAFGHSPEVCLPLSGAKLEASLPDRQLELGGRMFLVKRWAFSHPLFEKKIHAYKFAHSSNLPFSEMAFANEMVRARLRLFFKGELMPGIEIAIGVVQGTNHAEEAWRRFARFTRKTFPSP